MKLAIMQPYFLPYLGYFQLIAAVDKFVIYDDVQFIKGGWINRNRILLRGRPHFLTAPLSGASPHRRINELQLVSNPNWRGRLLKTIAQAYRGAPYFDEVFPLLESLIGVSENRLADFLRYSLVRLMECLEIRPQLITSSTVYGNAHLRGVERVLDICNRENADVYVNARGGRELYDPETFRRRAISLRFLEAKPIEYEQGTPTFHPDLSIVDVLMFNGTQLQALLQNYRLVA